MIVHVSQKSLHRVFWFEEYDEEFITYLTFSVESNDANDGSRLRKAEIVRNKYESYAILHHTQEPIIPEGN